MTAAKKAPAKRKPRAAKVLVLRTCDENLRGHGGFQWPVKGIVSAPDWSPAAECGRGLHGLLWGRGDGSLLNWDAGARWLVVEVSADEIVDLGGKVKFPRGKVVHVGDQQSATRCLAEISPDPSGIVGGTATAGYRGTATAGDGGTATAGYRGTATAGYGGTATAGYRGTATAGYGGTIAIQYWDPKHERYRVAIGEVDADGALKPGVPYVVVDGVLVPKVTP